MPSKSRKGPEPFTVEVSASELPQGILNQFPEPPPADARFAITIEPAESEAEKLATLQHDLQAGLDDLTAGRMSEAQEVFARLKKRFQTG